MIAGAEFSPCRTWRYRLWRTWGDPAVQGVAMFIGLNPSTADETRDDPTIRRCIGFARAWGYGGLLMLNAFAFRATAPADMRAAEDPVGPDNDAHLRAAAEQSAVAVAAWGVHGIHRGRDRAVRALLPALHVLRLTAAGHPAHPLYLPKTLRPIPWRITES